jgi:CxxC-x17-CxxC domain-containing protein
MAKFKYKKDFKSERSSSRDSRPERPFRKDFDRSAPRFSEDRPPRRFDRDEGSHRSSRLLELFDATCAKCGKACQIPFRPTNNKPVYCRECFKKNEGEEPRRFEKRDSAPRRFEKSDAPRRFESRSESPETELQKINRKLDKIIEALDID